MIVLESKDGKKGTLHQKRVRQRRKSLTDTHMTIRSLSKTLQTTALLSSPLLAPTRYTWLQWTSTSIVPDILVCRGILCACIFLVRL